MIPAFVKKFDFRGIYGEEIKDSDAYYLGLALIKTLEPKKVLIGFDTRISSRNLAKNFINALLQNNVDVSFLEKCPIDYITAAAFNFDFDLSIMFTGSHNPWTWTGLLMHTKGGDSVQGKTVNKIVENYNKSLSKPYENKDIDFSQLKDFTEQIENVYSEKIKALIPLDEIKEMKVLVDIGDGSGSKSLSVLEKLLPQVKFSRINDRNLYDESSVHTADPSILKNMEELMQEVKNGNFNCGFSFDSDADRVLAVDEGGNHQNGSLLGSAYIEAFTQMGLTDYRFGYAVDCGPSIANCVSKLKKVNGEISVNPITVGRSLVRKSLRENIIDLGVENVGHFYSRDFFMTDSGVFSIAVILSWISLNGALSSLSIKYPDGLRGEIFSEIIEEDTIKKLVKDILENIKIENFKEIDLDGIRYEFYENDLLTAWFTIRKSGYETITKCYYGALSEEKFNILKEKFESTIKT